MPYLKIEKFMHPDWLPARHESKIALYRGPYQYKHPTALDFNIRPDKTIPEHAGQRQLHSHVESASGLQHQRGAKR